MLRAGCWDSDRTYELGLGDRLRLTREAAGYEAQRDFAKATGLSKNTISNYETGKTAPRSYVLEKWAQVTGYDRGWLETGEEPASEGGTPREE